MKERNRDADNIRVAISHGDFNGISYEVILKTLADKRISEMCTPLVYGSSKIASYHRKTLKISDFEINMVKRPEHIQSKKVNIYNIFQEEAHIELGVPTEQSGKFAFIALEKAVEDLKSQKVDVLVTGPINKKNIQREKFDFPGHTEYLAKSFNVNQVLMLMVCDDLRIGTVTGHLPLSEVVEKLTINMILDKIRILDASLKQDFSIRKPKIAVLGVNPHAGDGGLLGKEENEIIIPAIKKAHSEGVLALGPFAADGFFGSSQFKKFDAIIAMYHDQGLIPFKTLAFEGGVNYTAGLPIVRTSPAHGTAYDIAGKDSASEESFRQALYLACDIYKSRLEYFEINEDPLKFYLNTQEHEDDDIPDEEDSITPTY
ncbi:MAG: 4-hydroxythreonine-4-phosphate dehydrogenase PdxA [Bacteroidales bacterium]|nr:4-hydroxythreonine-4-phosphate dehydrogenase PdxA [Bacteroidales bacterium]